MFTVEKSKDAVLVLKMTEKRLDAAVSVTFKQQMEPYLNQGHKYIIFDFEDVLFVDSSGLGAIVSVIKRLGLQGHVLVCKPQPAVRELLRLTRMDQVIPVHASQDEALEALRE